MNWCSRNTSGKTAVQNGSIYMDMYIAKKKAYVLGRLVYLSHGRVSHTAPYSFVEGDDRYERGKPLSLTYRPKIRHSVAKNDSSRNIFNQNKKMLYNWIFNYKIYLILFLFQYILWAYATSRNLFFKHINSKYWYNNADYTINTYT